MMGGQHMPARLALLLHICMLLKEKNSAEVIIQSARYPRQGLFRIKKIYFCRIAAFFSSNTAPKSQPIDWAVTTHPMRYCDVSVHSESASQFTVCHCCSGCTCTTLSMLRCRCRARKQFKQRRWTWTAVRQSKSGQVWCRARPEGAHWQIQNSERTRETHPGIQPLSELIAVNTAITSGSIYSSHFRKQSTKSYRRVTDMRLYFGSVV